MPAEPPPFCDFDCPSADFAPAQTAGLCRTMSAVWCRRLRALVNKNAPCEWRRRRAAAAPRRRPRSEQGGGRARR